MVGDRLQHETPQDSQRVRKAGAVDRLADLGFQPGSKRGHQMPDVIHCTLITHRQVDDKPFRQVHYKPAKPDITNNSTHYHVQTKSHSNIEL